MRLTSLMRPWSSTEEDDDVRRVRYQIEIGPYWANGSSGPVSAVCTDTAAGASCLTTLARSRASSSSLAPRTRNFQRRITGPLGQRYRVMMRWQLDTHLPLGVPGGQRLPRLLGLETPVLRLALLVGLRHRDVRVLPFLLDRMPPVEREVGAETPLGHHLADHLIRFVGGLLGARVEKDARVTSAHSDAVAEPTAHVVLHLVLAQGLQRPPDMPLIVKRDRYPPVVVCHGPTLPSSPGPHPRTGASARPYRPADPRPAGPRVGRHPSSMPLTHPRWARRSRSRWSAVISSVPRRSARAT